MHLSFFLLLTSYCPLRAPGRAFWDLIKSCQPTQRCHRTMTRFHGRLPQKGIKSWEVLTSSIYIIVSGDVGWRRLYGWCQSQSQPLWIFKILRCAVWWIRVQKSNLGKYLGCSLFVLAGGVSSRYFRMNAMWLIRWCCLAGACESGETVD